MVKTIVIQQIQFNNAIFKIGDRVRVLLKNYNEYIGTVTEILPESFAVNVEGDKNTFPVDTVKKIRIARANESFNNTWGFEDTGAEKYCVMAIKKGDRSVAVEVLSDVSIEKAQQFCEEWGWSYDDGKASYWLNIERMN